jgi:hypothetical protein
MLSYFHHHSTGIRSTTNVKAMKKFAYLCAFLMSITSFRSFIEPLGFASDVSIDSLAFVDIIAQLSVIIDANPNDLCIKNLRNQLENLIFAGVNDQIDRKRLAADISTLTSLDTQEDGFSIVPDSEDSEKWTIPGDIPMAEITQVIQDLPLFPPIDIVNVKCPRLLMWNLSLWIAQPFVKYANYKPLVDAKDLSGKIEALRTILPSKLEFTNETQFITHMGLFISLEVKALNDILVFTLGELDRFLTESTVGRISEDAILFSQGELPPKWRSVTQLWLFRAVNQYSTHIIERHAQLVRILQEISPVVFDMRLVENPRFLLEAYLADNAVETNRSFDSLQYEFIGTEGVTIEAGALFLTRLTIIAGDLRSGVVSVNRNIDDPPATIVSALVAKLVPKGKGDSTAAPVPLYREGFVSGLGGRKEQEVTTSKGDSDNFVCNIMLPLDSAESTLLQAGTRFVCRIPAQMT